MKSKLILLCFLFLTSFFFIQSEGHAESIGDQMGLNPFWDYKTIESEHFRLTFPKELSTQALQITNYYEDAHKLLSKELKWEPNHKVQVLLTDQYDAANGMTSPVSRFGMILYLTPPETWFSTTYYDDWVKLLVVHEYTHYLNMDVTTGIFKIARFIFGDVILPNSLLPTWMLEGLAVLEETKFTRAGRGRSSYFEMISRTAVLENVLNNPKYITLDKINGENPQPPGGETPYFFGYQMMNEAEKNSELENPMGVLSYRSGGRFPYFINGNLENTIQKNWNQIWLSYVEKTKLKSEKDIAEIKKNPVTTAKKIESTGYESFGSAINSDETLLAYTSEKKEKWSSLYLKNLKTGEELRIEDKFYGVGMSFHPKSPTLFYSTLHRENQYSFYSELKVYHLDTKKSYFITKNLRAKDPDLSKDGKFITFTTAATSGSSLSIALLNHDKNEFSISKSKVIYNAPLFDRIGNPKFSPDGKFIVFSYKKNGSLGEEIRRYEMKTGKIETLVSNTAMNRFPVYHPNGELYYVSDLNGVDNLYRYNSNRSIAVTNMLTGVWLPSISEHKVIASVYETDGWKLAEIPLKDTSLSTISPANGPQSLPENNLKLSQINYPIQNYSALPSLLPRQWSPLFLLSSDTSIIGAQVFGYDAVMRHQYFAYGLYDTTLKTGDYSISYQNRLLPPTLGLSAQNSTKNVTYSKSSSTFTKKLSLEGNLSFPFKWDVASLTPQISASVEREMNYNTLQSLPLSKTQFVPTQSASLTFKNTRASRWAIAPESGVSVIAGAKRYNDSEIENFKGIFKATSYHHLGGNMVFSPALKLLGTSKQNNRFYDANGVITGREDRLFNPFGSDDFDQFYMRGYLNRTFNTTRTFIGSTDLRFPLAQIFRGWGTNPFFIDQLSMNLFAETGYSPNKSSNLRWTPSAGVGLKCSTEILLHFPFIFGIDYQYGFNQYRRTNAGGDLFFSLQLSNLLPIDL